MIATPTRGCSFEEANDIFNVTGSDHLFTPVEARRVLGRGVYRGIDINSEDSVFEIIPFSAETIRAAASTHALVPIAPLSVVDLQRRHHFYQYDRRDRRNRYRYHSVPAQPGWALVHLEKKGERSRRPFGQRQSFLRTDEMVASASVVAQTAFLMYRYFGIRPYTYGVLTSDIDHLRRRVLLEDLPSQWLALRAHGCVRDDEPSYGYCIATCKVPLSQ